MEKLRLTSFFLLQMGLIFILLEILTGCSHPAATVVVEGNTVIYDQLRFTVLNDGLVKISGEHAIEDPYLQNNTPIPVFTTTTKGDTLVLNTAMSILKYWKGEGEWLTRVHLFLENETEQRVVRDLTVQDDENLGGLIKSLDRCDGALEYETYELSSPAKSLDIPKGLLSRRGWTILKRVQGTLVHADREGAANAWYIFAYGTDYRQAMQDFTQLNGQVPLLPIWSLGNWFSRYQPLKDTDYQRIVAAFRKREIPLDVILPDMNWHKDGWFGLRYDESKFPDMEAFLAWTEQEGIHVGFNHHPGGVSRDDPRAKGFIKKLGLDYDSLENATDKIIETNDWDGFHNTLFYGEHHPENLPAFFETFLNPIMDAGLDFHWVDGTPSTGDLDAYYHLTEQQVDKRSFVLTRQVAGSFDHHRYPIGFSADTYISWESLQYTVAQTIQGANMGVYWSHDIGGHMERYPNMKHDEMMVRWVQSGALSPFCRLHATGGVEWDHRKAHIRQPWKWAPKAYEASKKALQLKYQLLPYTYTLNRLAHDTGLLICHGMYMDYPKDIQAYQYGRSQYMYGSNLLVAPIGQPASDGSGLEGKASQQVWLPAGDWYDFFTEEKYAGNAEILVAKPIDEMPLFVKAGSIIPMTAGINYTGQLASAPYQLHVYPATDGKQFAFKLYEDDGKSLAYQQGQAHRWISLKADYQLNNHNSVAKGRLSIAPAQGDYLGAPKTRTYSLHIHLIGQKVPQEVKLNQSVLSKDQWTAAAGVLTIKLGSLPVEKGFVVTW